MLPPQPTPGGASHFLSGRNGAPQRAALAADMPKLKQASRTPNAAARFGCSFKHCGSDMDREVMMRETFGVREACFRFAIKPVKVSDEPYVGRGSSLPKTEMRIPSIPSTKNPLVWRIACHKLPANQTQTRNLR